MANSFFKIKQGLNLANYANEAALSGIPNPQVGDLVTVGSGAVYTYNGSNWVDVGSSGSVVSVNGQTGVVNLETEDIPENVNLYFTDARAQSAAVINSLAGSETDKAPSVSSVNGAIRFLPENARYVAKNGSDVTGNGSELAPFQTIQAALDSLPAPVPSSDIPECVIYVYPGVYNQTLSWTRSNTHIIGMQAPRKNIQAVTLKGGIDFNIAIAEPGGIFQNISSISNCLVSNESGSTNTINFIGAERVILHLLNSQVYQAVSGYSAIYMNNTSASLSRLYADNCVIQAVANGLGHALDLVKGALWSCVNTEIYRTGAADASSRAIKMSNNSLVTGVKLSTIGSAGTYGIEMGGTGGCTVGTSVIETYSANKSGVLVGAGTALTAINCVFNVVAGTGYAVDGPAGSFFAYSANTYAANALINPLISKIQFASDTTTSVIAEGTNQYFTAARAQTAAVVDSTAGSETNQAPSVSAMKAYVGSISSGVTSVNGDTGPAVSLDSGEIPEGSNLYFTDARAQSAAVVNSTAGTEENQAPSVSAMKAYVGSISSGVTSVNGDTGPAVSLDSGEIPEGSNLYFTDARAQTAAVVDSTAGGELNQAPSVHSMKEYVTSAVATETAARESADALLIPLSQKGVADGVATLDNTGKVPASQIPPTAITSVTVVATIAERDALTPQEGDFCVVTDVNETFVYDGADWIELQVGGGITSVNGQAGPAVSLSTADISEVTNLYFTDARAKLAAVIDSSAGSETDQAMSVAAAKMFTFDSVQTETLARQAADALLIPLSEKGAANGVATLDGSGLVPSSQLPAYPSVPVTSVNTQTGAVVLDTDDVAEGTGAPAGWSSTASLAIPRSGLAAAGTQSAALAFSGETNSGFTTSSESFNGLSWSLGGDMALARSYLGGVGIQSAALAFGGSTTSGLTNSVEAYDGSSWSSATSMINVRFGPGGAGLQNAALAFGGETGSGISSSSESYDGSTWAVAPSMNTARSLMAGIGIQNAAVSIGGSSNSGYSNVTETYDGASWSLSGNLSIARERLAGAGTQNAGLAFGGEGAGGKTNLTEAFNGSSWTTASNMGTVRTSLGGAGSQSAALSIGGINSTNNNSAVTEKYNGASAANLYFTATRAQTAAVIDSTAGSETDQAPSVSAMKAYVASLPSGGITSVNGDTGPLVSLDSGEIPEGSNLYFTDARAQTAAVINTTAGNETEQAASVSAMKAYVSSLPAGGVTSVNSQTNTVVLDTDDISESVGATNQWFTNARAQTAAVVNSTAGSETDQAASVSAMKSYVASQGAPVTSVNTLIGAVLLDTGNVPEGGSASASWSASGALLSPSQALAGAGSQSAALGAGGFANSNVTQKYNGISWSSTGNMIAGRRDLGLVGLQSAALAFGGNTGSSSATAEKFDGSSWSSTASMSTARSALGGAGLQNAALAFGGTGASNYALTEKFNGSVWSSSGSLSVARIYPVGAGTQDAALAFSGATFTGPPFFQTIPSALTEMFNGSTWSTTGSMITARDQAAGAGSQTAALAFGGYSTSIHASSEEFNTSTWSASANMISARQALAGAGSQSSAVSFGGNAGSGQVATTENYNGGYTSGLYFTNTRAQTAAVVNSTAGSETDQAASVSAMKSYVAASIPSGSATLTTAGYALSSSALNTQTGSYTILSSDNGRIIIVNSATAVNITVPSGLDVGFNCMVVQIGAGQVTMVASGTTLNSASGLKISAQHGALSIISYSSNVFNVAGNTAV